MVSGTLGSPGCSPRGLVGLRRRMLCLRRAYKLVFMDHLLVTSACAIYTFLCVGIRRTRPANVSPKKSSGTGGIATERAQATILQSKRIFIRFQRTTNVQNSIHDDYKSCASRWAHLPRKRRNLPPCDFWRGQWAHWSPKEPFSHLKEPLMTTISALTTESITQCLGDYGHASRLFRFAL